MLLLNAKFFPPKCSVSLQKKSVKRSLAAHYKKAFLPQITAQVMWRLMRSPIDNAPAHWWPNQHGWPPQNYCWNLSSAWLYYHSIWKYFLNLECKSSFFRKKNVFILFEKICFLGKSHQIGPIMLNSFPSLKCWHDVWKPTLPSFKDELLPGVLVNKGTGALIFREQGIFSNYFQGTRELLNRLLGTREHQSNLSVKWGWQACTTPQRVF